MTTPIDDQEEQAAKAFRALPRDTQAMMLWHQLRDLIQAKRAEHTVLRRGLYAVVAVIVAVGIMVGFVWYRSGVANDRQTHAQRIQQHNNAVFAHQGQELHDLACATLGIIRAPRDHKERVFVRQLRRICPQGPGGVGQAPVPVPQAGTNSSRPASLPTPINVRRSESRSAPPPGQQKAPGSDIPSSPGASALPSPTPSPTPSRTRPSASSSGITLPLPTLTLPTLPLSIPG